MGDCFLCDAGYSYSVMLDTVTEGCRPIREGLGGGGGGPGDVL